MTIVRSRSLGASRCDGALWGPRWTQLCRSPASSPRQTTFGHPGSHTSGGSTASSPRQTTFDHPGSHTSRGSTASAPGMCAIGRPGSHSSEVSPARSSGYRRSGGGDASRSSRAASGLDATAPSGAPAGVGAAAAKSARIRAFEPRSVQGRGPHRFVVCVPDGGPLLLQPRHTTTRWFRLLRSRPLRGPSVVASCSGPLPTGAARWARLARAAVASLRAKPTGRCV